MTCEELDWKAYTLGEMSAVDRRQAEQHAETCERCHLEVAQLRLTLDAMSTLREEEVPHRIAFVSDKVFEPRWWQQLWNPTFAAACLVAGAILVHAFVQPGNSALQQAQIDAAVARAMATQQAEIVATYELMDKQFKQMYKTTAGIVRQ